MRTLILSCNTGEGHNSCAKAIQEHFTSIGEDCVIADALSFLSERVSSFICNWHVRIYRHCPGLFRFGYGYSEKHPAVFHENSKIYQWLTAGTQRMYQAICDGKYDAVICTHVFSALMLTAVLKRHPLPITSCFLATDYTCSPITKDSALDLYFIPDDSLRGEFEGATTPVEKMVSSGIPVRQMFYTTASKEEAKRSAHIPSGHKHLLMMCGSMGCGPIKQLAKLLSRQMRSDCDLTIVCGTNRRLRKRLETTYANRQNIHITGYVQNMSTLMDSADLYLTKPGGISVAEATLKSLPMVFIDAVAGCEEYNRAYYVKKGGAATASSVRELAAICLTLLENDNARRQMSDALAALPKHNAAQVIYTYLSKFSSSTATLSIKENTPHENTSPCCGLSEASLS